MGFLHDIKTKYSYQIYQKIKEYININSDIMKFNSNKKFLIQCRHNKVFHKKILNTVGKFQSLHFHSYSIKKRIIKIQDNFKITLLNLEIQDLHNHLNYLNKQKKNIEIFLQKNFEIVTYKKIIDYQQNRYRMKNNNNNNNLDTRLKTKLDYLIENQQNNYLFENLNQHKRISPEFSYVNDPWLVNLTEVQIPQKIQDLLTLGNQFSNSTFSAIKTRFLNS